MKFKRRWMEKMSTHSWLKSTQMIIRLFLPLSLPFTILHIYFGKSQGKARANLSVLGQPSSCRYLGLHCHWSLDAKSFYALEDLFITDAHLLILGPQLTKAPFWRHASRLLGASSCGWENSVLSSDLFYLILLLCHGLFLEISSKKDFSDVLSDMLISSLVCQQSRFQRYLSHYLEHLCFSTVQSLTWYLVGSLSNN